MLQFKEIKLAQIRLKKLGLTNQLVKSEPLSEITGGEIYLKLENLQKTGSFKVRGAFNAIAQIAPAKRKKGVITASAGNHAQGVAFASRFFGIHSEIIMPETTALIKVESVKKLGGNVILKGSSFDDAFEYALEINKKKSLTFIHPFDDYNVMAGQGTIGLEIMENLPDVDVIIIPVGGGGLASGISTAVKTINPEVHIYGVEASSASSAYLSLKKGYIVQLPVVNTIAEGIAVKSIGIHSFPILRKNIREVIVVEEEEIARSILFLMEQMKLIAEGAGAAPVAPLLAGKIDLKGKKAVLVISGGNIDVTMIERIIERGLIGAGRFLRISTELNDIPGALAGLTNAIAELRANILTIVHERKALNLPPGKTVVQLDLEVRGSGHIETIIKTLNSLGYRIKSGEKS